MRHSLAGLIFGLALLVFGPAAAQDIPAAQIRDVQQAVVWRAAGLRLRVVLGDMAEVMRGPALGAATEDWRRDPERANPGQEVAAVVAGAEIWLAAIEARMPGARWPADRPAAVYQREAELTLAQARFDLGYAAGALGSPARALAMVFMVDGWTQGFSFRNNPFNDLDAEADAALVAMLPMPSGGVAGAGGQPGSPGSTPFGSGGGAGGGGGGPGAYAAAPVYPPAPAFPPTPAQGDTGGGYGAGPVAGGLQAAWGGFAGDLTGVGGSGQPDGQTDGMVSVTLPADGRGVARIDVYSVNPQGQRTDGHWTTWSAGHWIIAVVIGGRRVSPPTLVDNLQAPAGPMVLFLANGGYLRDGDRYYVEVTFTDGSRATGPFTIGAVPASAGAVGGAPDYPGSPAPYGLPPSDPPGGVIDFNQPSGGYGSAGAGTGGEYGGSGSWATWSGHVGDLTGTGGSGRPDGQTDGMVSLTLPADGRRIARIDVHGVNDTGQRLGDRWTTWNSGNWLMAVVVGDQRINPDQMVGNLGAPSGRIVLFLGNGGYLTSGRRFEVEVVYTDGAVARAWFTIGQARSGSPPPSVTIPGAGGAAAGSVQVAWRGFGGDEISAGVSGQPDGQPDGAITLQFPGERRMLRRIDIHAIDERGQRSSSHWSSWDGVHWLMALRAREVRLNPRGPIDSLGLPAQPLTALITNDGSLKPGQRLEVEVTFTDGSTANGYTVVTP